MQIKIKRAYDHELVRDPPPPSHFLASEAGCFCICGGCAHWARRAKYGCLGGCCGISTQDEALRSQLHIDCANTTMRECHVNSFSQICLPPRVLRSIFEKKYQFSLSWQWLTLTSKLAKTLQPKKRLQIRIKLISPAKIPRIPGWFAKFTSALFACQSPSNHHGIRRIFLSKSTCHLYDLHCKA